MSEVEMILIRKSYPLGVTLWKTEFGKKKQKRFINT